MNPKNSLESVYFINIPEDFSFSQTALEIDRTIPLPVQKKNDTSDFSENFSIKELEPEQVLAGILSVLAHDKNNPHLDYYRSILKKARPDIEKELSEAAVLKAKNEDWDMAEELFLTLRGIAPENPAILLNTAVFLDQRAESYRRSGLHEDADAYDNDAANFYSQAMEAEPPLADAFFNAGFFHLKQHDFSKAKDAFETYIALTCDISDEELGENGIYKKERAQEIINGIANDNMEDLSFRNAYKLISSGQEEKGLEEIRKFLEKNPKVWKAWFILGWGLRKICHWEQAEQAFLQALDCGGKQNADCHNELALCLMELGNLKDAKKNLLKALEISPEDIKIISNLGYLSLKEGNIEEAKKFFRTVLVYDPKDTIAGKELEKLERKS